MPSCGSGREGQEGWGGVGWDRMEHRTWQRAACRHHRTTQQHGINTAATGFIHQRSGSAACNTQHTHQRSRSSASHRWPLGCRPHCSRRDGRGTAQVKQHHRNLLSLFKRWPSKVRCRGMALQARVILNAVCAAWSAAAVLRGATGGCTPSHPASRCRAAARRTAPLPTHWWPAACCASPAAARRTCGHAGQKAQQ